MNRGVKVTLVAGVLFGGIALALFFKKGPADERAAQDDPTGEAASDAVDLPELTPEEQAAGQRPASGSPAAGNLAGGPAANRWGQDTPVPKVSPAFEPSSSRPADSRWSQAEESDPFSDRPALSRGSPIAERPRSGLKYHVDDSAASSLAQPARVHKIADGDTLGALAQKYYGDATAGGEIFEANRQTLSDPELLPIGRELQIPPRASTTVQKPTQAADASDLVPVGTK